MAGKIHTEEKGIYQLDCRSALWSTDEVHTAYHSSGLNVLSDADFVAETEDCIYLVEYKNANVPEAVAHQADFNPNKAKYIQKVARKFFDSLHYLTMKEKRKPIKYVYIVEFPAAGATERRMLRNNIASQLPFLLQSGQAYKLIDSFQVVSIDEWNAHEEYSMFPLIPVTQGAST